MTYACVGLSEESLTWTDWSLIGLQLKSSGLAHSDLPLFQTGTGDDADVDGATMAHRISGRSYRLKSGLKKYT
jgi:hypothetical protein